ncbi:MAG: Gfo/Idh/MocA family protein, partial [Bacteroidota bacterium]
MVRVAIIGYGYWGPNLVRNFSSLPGARVVRVADLRQERRDAVSHQYPGVAVTADIDSVCSDPDTDAVVIATPVFTHYPLARKALEAGKHVLIEKPMTDTVAHAEELIQLAERMGLLLMVDHTFLYTPAVQKMKALIDSGGIGRVKYFDSTRINLGLIQQDVNVLW